MKTLLLLAAGKAKGTLPVFLNDTNTFLYAAICALGFLLLAIVISSLIKFEPGNNPKDPQKRRICFWVLGVLATILVFVLLFVVFMQPSVEVLKSGELGKFTDADLITYSKNLKHYEKMAGIATGACFVLYVLLGFILSKIFKTKKIGNWF